MPSNPPPPSASGAEPVDYVKLCEYTAEMYAEQRRAPWHARGMLSLAQHLSALREAVNGCGDPLSDQGPDGSLFNCEAGSLCYDCRLRRGHAITALTNSPSQGAQE